MELLIQNLPSGKLDYKFNSIKIMPMNFAQILEYMENVPSNPVEKYYFDYKLVQADDPNVDELLLTDLDYVVFFKKGLTVSRNLEFKISTICPIDKTPLSTHVSLSNIKFNKLDDTLLKGLNVKMNGQYHAVRMPTVAQFMKIFSKYRLYKKITDMKLIKLISLFEDTEMYHQKYETMVINAEYEDITLLASLDELYFNSVEPIITYCPECNNRFEREKLKNLEHLLALGYKEDSNEYQEVLNSKERGIAVGMDSLIADFFRSVIENNRLTESQIVPREIS